MERDEASTSTEEAQSWPRALKPLLSDASLDPEERARAEEARFGGVGQEKEKGEMYEYVVVRAEAVVTEEEIDRCWEENAAREGRRLALEQGSGSGEMILEVGEEVLRQRGSAESREPAGRGYEGGSGGDRLWQGGGQRPIPEGLRRMAQGSGGGGEEGEGGGEEDQGGGNDDGGGSDDDGQDQDENEDAPNPDSAIEPPEPPSYAASEHYQIFAKEEKTKVEPSKRIYGVYDMRTAKAMSTVAEMWSNNGYFKDSERLRLEALEVTERVVGPYHRDTMLAMADIASSYIEQSRHAEAEPLQYRVYQWHRDHIGLNNHKSLAVMGVLAGIWTHLGRHEEAKQLWTTILALRRAHFRDTRMLVKTMLELAESHWVLKQYDENVNLLQEAKELALDGFGLDDPLTIKVYEALMRSYIRLGNDTDVQGIRSEELTTKARLALMEVMRGEYAQIGRYTESIDQGLQLLEHTMNSPGPNHESAIKLTTSLCDILPKAGLTRAADQQIKELISLTVKISGIHHSITTTLLSRRATILNSLNAHLEAEELWTQVLGLSYGICGEDSKETMGALAELAFTWTKLGRYQEAVKLQNRVVGWYRRRRGPEHEDTREAVGTLGRYVAEMMGGEDDGEGGGEGLADASLGGSV